MNFLKKETKAAWTRFKEFILPPAVRYYKPSKPGVRISRYPAPGSEPTDIEESYIDYKTAYRDSTHNIRYNVDLHLHNEGYVYLADGLTTTTAEKLVQKGVLKKEQIKDPAAIEEAKKRYLEIFEESVDVKVHQDDLGISQKLNLDLNKREMASELVANLFDGVNTQNEGEAWLNDLNEVYNAQFYFLKSLDLAADNPVLRQLHLDLEFYLEGIIENRLAMGKYPVFKGNSSYWQVLDDSFDAENRRKVQATIKSYVSAVADTTPAIQEDVHPEEFRSDTIDVPTVTQFVK